MPATRSKLGERFEQQCSFVLSVSGLGERHLSGLTFRLSGEIFVYRSRSELVVQRFVGRARDEGFSLDIAKLTYSQTEFDLSLSKANYSSWWSECDPKPLVIY